MCIFSFFNKKVHIMSIASKNAYPNMIKELIAGFKILYSRIMDFGSVDVWQERLSLSLASFTLCKCNAHWSQDQVQIHWLQMWVWPIIFLRSMNVYMVMTAMYVAHCFSTQRVPVAILQHTQSRKSTLIRKINHCVNTLHNFNLT